MSRLLAFAWGALFALGVSVARVAQPTTILGHLDPFGSWDPTLLVALSAGATVYAIVYFGVGRYVGGAFAVSRVAPTSREVDRPLLLGASLFGAGWGIAGMCPGAVLVSVAHPDGRPLLFALAMVAGMLAHGLTRRRRWSPRLSAA